MPPATTSYAIVADPGRARHAEGVAQQLGATWARLDDQVIMWGPTDAGATELHDRLHQGLRIERSTGGQTSGQLHLVLQVGRTFQDMNPSVRVLVGKGRYLVVDLEADDLASLTHHDEICWAVRPLQPGTVVLDRPSPRAVRPATRVSHLVGAASRPTYESYLTNLASWPTRHSLSQFFVDAAAWAADGLQRLGYTVTRQEIAVQGARSYNIVADRAGSGSQRRVIMITAHLDSINQAGGPQATAPGADDNGSGAAGVLEIARVFSLVTATHDLRLILFGGEEQGLLGSSQYVAGLSPAERARIQAVINMDMIATRNTSDPTVLLESAAHADSLMTVLAEAAAAYTSLAVQTSLNPFASDHVPFLNALIPAVLTIEGSDSANGNVHTANDTLAHIDWDLALEIVRMNVAAAASLLEISAGADLLQTTGKVTLLRAHDLGTSYGPPGDQIDVEVVIQLDSEPGKAFGFQLRDDANRLARKSMLDLLGDAFNNAWTITIDYEFAQRNDNGIIRRVWVTR